MWSLFRGPLVIFANKFQNSFCFASVLGVEYANLILYVSVPTKCQSTSDPFKAGRILPTWRYSKPLKSDSESLEGAKKK